MLMDKKKLDIQCNACAGAMNKVVHIKVIW